MSTTPIGGRDAVFAGSVPQLYESHMVPLLFEPYAGEMARRAATLSPARVLETAAGTGVVTRALAQALPPDVEIVATDLNPPMLERARAVGTARSVQWQAADAQALPFEDASFDLVVCQFGVMFFPDRPRAFAEALRVLRPGGTLLFSAWDRIELNEFTDVIVSAVATLFPQDPPRFMARTPHGYFDVEAIARDLAAGGFASAPHIDTVAKRSRAPSAREPAVAICQGSPMRDEIVARGGPEGLADATRVAELALAERFGTAGIEGWMQAHVVAVRR
jgi:SAM-dependent methyltransferase